MQNETLVRIAPNIKGRRVQRVNRAFVFYGNNARCVIDGRRERSPNVVLVVFRHLLWLI